MDWGLSVMAAISADILKGVYAEKKSSHFDSNFTEFYAWEN